MAVQQGQSSLFGKFAGKVVEAHKTSVSKEPEIYGQSLPPGIKNGVARLVKLFIDKHKGKDDKDKNNGLPEFMMVAVCVYPVVFDNVQCKGKQFRLMPPLPLYDTPTWKTGGSFIEHYNRMVDYLRVFVGKNVWQQSGYFGGETQQQIEANIVRCMKDLSEKGPYFNFTTVTGKKQKVESKGGKFWVGANSFESEEKAKEANPWLDSDPRTEIRWGDLVPNYTEGTNGTASAFNDQTGNGEPDPAVLTPDNEFNNQETQGEHFVDPESELSPESNAAEVQEGEPDLDDLVAQAPDDEDAREQLISIAGSLGIDRETAENTNTWSDLKDMIVAAQDNTESALLVDEPIADPKKDDVAKYQLVDAKGQPLKDKAKKLLDPVSVKIVSVNVKTKTVILKNLEDAGKTILGGDKKALQVAWDKLLPSD